MQTLGLTTDLVAPVPKDDVTVVIPTLNEEQAIGKVLDELKLFGYEKILVADGRSTDRTIEIAKSKGATVVRQIENNGKSGALHTAFRLVKTPYVLVMDGDNTYNPEDIERLLECATLYDEIIGVRRKGKEHIPLLNRFGNFALTSMFDLLFGKNLNDICSGMYLLKTKVAKEIPFETRGFSSEVEVAAYVLSTNKKIGQIEIDYRERLGNKKLTRWDGVKIALSSLRLATNYNPVFFIFALSALVIIPGLLVMGWVAYQYLLIGQIHYIWAIIGVLLSGIGFLSSLFALQSLFIKRMEYRIVDQILELTK